MTALNSVEETLGCDHIHLKATEQYFMRRVTVLLNNAVLGSNSVDKTLVCDHSNESD